VWEAELKRSLSGALGLLAVASCANAASPAPSGPERPPETEFNLLCTVTDAGLSKDCRFYVGIADASERLKAGTVLAWLDAHPFRLRGADPGATAKATVSLQVDPSRDHAGFDVTAPYGVFPTSAEPEITDPVWRVSPYKNWTDEYLPERSVRMNIVGEATVSCIATEAGTLTRCRVLHESPPDGGFGWAVSRLLGHVRMQPLTASGAPVTGRSLVLTLRYPGAKVASDGLYHGRWSR
jgi:hypothetical protein